MKIDIRDQSEKNCNYIQFADPVDEAEIPQAHYLDRPAGRINVTCAVFSRYFSISDGAEEVVINSKEHAFNLIKALEKAIELGWVK